MVIKWSKVTGVGICNKLKAVLLKGADGAWALPALFLCPKNVLTFSNSWKHLFFCENSECFPFLWRLQVFYLKFRSGSWQSSILSLLNTVIFRSKILSAAPDTWPLWVFAIYFHFFLYSSWCNHSGEPEQSEPYQHCPPCWLLPDRSHSWHHHSCPGGALPAGAVHHLQAEAEREGDTHAHRDLHPCYEGHQCRLHHFRYVNV